MSGSSPTPFTLRPFQLSDLERLTSLLTDPEVMRFGPGPLDSNQSEAWLRAAIAREQPLAVCQQGRLSGYCGLFDIPDVNGRPEVELGYRFFPSCWGHGLATQTGRMVLRLAFEQRALSRVISLIDPANLASRRVAEKLGMRLEAEAMLPGYDYPDLVYVARPTS